MAGGIGLVSLFLIVAIAVAIFIFCGFRNNPYKFIDEDVFEMEYGVKGMVKEKQNAYRTTYVVTTIIGTCLCILSPVALFVGAILDNDFLTIITLTITIGVVAIGVLLLIVSGVRWASMQKLLKEGNYTNDAKKKNKIKESVGGIYWLTATAIFLGWSFLTNDWDKTWIVWPVAGVLFAAVMAICNLLIGRKEQN